MSVKSLFNHHKLITIISIALTSLIALQYFSKPIFAQSTPTVAIQPSQTLLNVGDTLTVNLNVNNVTNLGGYEFTLNFDPTILQATAANDAGFITSTGRTSLPLGPNIDNTTGSLTFAVSTLGAQTGVSGNGALATITFTALASGTSPLTIDDNFSLLTPTAETINAPFPSATSITVGQVTPTSNPTPTPTPTPTSQPTPTTSATPTATPTPTTLPSPTPTSTATNSAQLSLVPADPATQPTTDQPYTILLNLTTDSPVTGVDVILNLNPSLFTITEFTSNDAFDLTPLIDFNNGNGTLRFSAIQNPGNPFTGTTTLATLVLTPKVGQSGQIVFDFSPGSTTDSNVIHAQTGRDILTQPQPLNLTIIDPAMLQLQIQTWNQFSNHSVSGELNGDDNFTTTLTTDESGLSQLIDLPSAWIGQLREFTFKVTGYLRKRFSHTITPQANLVDIGQLQAGDLNDDGIINTVDLGIMYPQWGAAGTADFSGDSIVNTADYWIIIQNYLQEDE